MGNKWRWLLIIATVLFLLNYVEKNWEKIRTSGIDVAEYLRRYQ